MSQDPIGLAGGNPTLYGFVLDPSTESDVLGLGKKKNCKPIYRYLNEGDARRLKQGKGLKSKGKGGTIQEHIGGKKNTKYISASEGSPDPTYDSGYGLVRINPEGTKFVDHKNVLQGVKGNSLNTSNATRAKEVLFKNEIPFENIEIIDLP